MTLFEILGKITIQQDGAIKALDDVEKKADSSSSKMNSSFTKVGGLLKGALVAGAAAAAAGIAALGIAGLKSAGDMETATDRMQAKLGVTADEAKRLGGVAESVFKNNFAGSLTDAVGMVETLRQKLGAMSDEQTKKLTEMGATISDLYGADYAETVGNAQTLMDNFGLSAEQAFDFITTGYQKGLDAGGDFSDSINEYATQFKNGGATADQFFGVLESGMQNGVLGTDKAADAFKEFRLRIQDGSKLTGDSLRQIGIDSDAMAEQISSGQITAADAFQTVITKLGETEDPMIRMQAGAGLIGSQFEDLGDTAVQELSLATTSLDEMAGATDRAGQAAYDNLGGKMSTLWRTLQTEAMNALEPLIPYISQFVDILIERAPLMIDAGKEVASYLEKWGPSIGAIIEEVSTVFSDAFTAMSLLWENVLKPSWDAIEPFVSGLFEALGKTIEGFMLLLEGDFVGAAESAWDGFKAAFTGLSKTVVSIVTGIWGLVEQPLIDLKDDIVNKATEAKDGFLEQFTDLRTKLWEKVIDLWAYIAGPIASFRNSVVNIAIEVYNGFKDNFEDLNNKVVEIISGLWDGVKSHLETFATNIVNQITGIPDRIKDVGQNIVDNLISGITGKKSDLEKATSDTVGVVEETAADTLETHSPSKALYKIGQYVVQGLAGGISDTDEVKALTTAAGNMGQSAVDAVSAILGNNTLQDEAKSVGESLVQGLIDGFNEAFPGFSENVNRLLAALKENARHNAAVRGYQGQMGQNVRDTKSAAAIRADTELAMLADAALRWRTQMGFNTDAERLAFANRAEARRIADDTELAQRQFANNQYAAQMQQNAINEGEARRIMLDTEAAQRNVEAVNRQNTNNYIDQLDVLRAQGALATQQNINANLAGTVAWIGSSLGSAVTWIGSTLGGAVTWIGGALTSVADFMGDVMVGLGSSLLNLAGSQIPWLGASMDAMAGGPIAMLTAFLVSLIGETWQFQEIISLATSIVKPLISILGDLIGAIWPLIQVVTNYLKVAFSVLGTIIKNVVTPVFGFVARVIATVWNALARAINWALGWLGVNVPTINVSAGPTNSGFANGSGMSGYQKPKSPRSEAVGAGTSMAKGYSSPKTPKTKSPKAPKTSAPKVSKPKTKAPGYKAPKSPGGSKSPGSGKAPGYSSPGKGGKSPSYSPGKGTGGAYGSAADISRGAGGTKVSEITGPTRDMFLDLLSPLVALPELVGIGSRTYDLLSQRLGAPNLVPVMAGGVGPTINNYVTLNATGDLNYDTDQFVDKVEAKLYRRFTTGKRGTGR